MGKHNSSDVHMGLLKPVKTHLPIRTSLIWLSGSSPTEILKISLLLPLSVSPKVKSSTPVEPCYRAPLAVPASPCISTGAPCAKPSACPLPSSWVSLQSQDCSMKVLGSLSRLWAQVVMENPSSQDSAVPLPAVGQVELL